MFLGLFEKFQALTLNSLLLLALALVKHVGEFHGRTFDVKPFSSRVFFPLVTELVAKTQDLSFFDLRVSVSHGISKCFFS